MTMTHILLVPLPIADEMEEARNDPLVMSGRSLYSEKPSSQTGREQESGAIPSDIFSSP